VAGALRDGSSANPPLNMHRSLIFTGVFGVTPALFTQFIRGKQSRRELDEEKNSETTSQVIIPDEMRTPSIERTVEKEKRNSTEEKVSIRDVEKKDFIERRNSMEKKDFIERRNSMEKRHFIPESDTGSGSSQAHEIS
jgi:hypothetical protein